MALAAWYGSAVLLVTGNTDTGVVSVNGGTLQSYGNNQITGNTTNGTTTPTPLN